MVYPDPILMLQIVSHMRVGSSACPPTRTAGQCSGRHVHFPYATRRRT